MNRAGRILAVVSILLIVVATALRATAASTSQSGLLNVVTILAAILLTVAVTWIIAATTIGRRGNQITTALTTLRKANPNRVVFACQVEQNFWLALRRLKADIEDAGPGPWPEGPLRGNFVCGVVDRNALTYWSVEPDPIELVTITRDRISDISIGPVPAGTTTLTGLILSITGTPAYTLTGVVEDESRPGYPAKLKAIPDLIDRFHETE